MLTTVSCLHYNAHHTGKALTRTIQNLQRNKTYCKFRTRSASVCGLFPSTVTTVLTWRSYYGILSRCNPSSKAESTCRKKCPVCPLRPFAQPIWIVASQRTEGGKKLVKRNVLVWLIFCLVLHDKIVHIKVPACVVVRQSLSINTPGSVKMAQGFVAGDATAVLTKVCSTAVSSPVCLNKTS